MALTVKQEALLEALLEGRTVLDASKVAGISRPAAYRYMADDEFNREMQRRQRQHRAMVDARLHGISEDAVKVLQDAITGKKVSRVALDSAREVLAKLERSEIKDFAQRLLDGDTPDDEPID
jgi:hypothetical protein